MPLVFNKFTTCQCLSIFQNFAYRMVFVSYAVNHFNKKSDLYLNVVAIQCLKKKRLQLATY
jgi:hypothetical protein